MTTKEESLLILIILTGIVFRLSLLNIGITLDESVTVYVANANGFSDLIERIATYEYSPPIYFWLMQQWVSVFGDKPTSIAVPSLISGTVLIPAVYIFLKELFGKPSVALLAAFFIAVSPLMVFFSHEARLYSLFALVMTFAFWAFVRSLKQTSLSRLAILFFAATLLLYCHYIAIFIIALMLVSAIVLSVLKKNSVDVLESSTWNFDLKKILAALLLAGVAFLPWAGIFFRHRSVGTFWVDSQPITNWPFVFASNLAATLPFPWIVGYCLVGLLVPVYLFVQALMLVRKKHSISTMSRVTSFPYILLLINLLVPISILGYVTPFIVGYCRYMVPFAVFSCSLLAAGVVFGITREQRWLSASKNLKVAQIVLLIAGLMFFNYLELVDKFGSDRSGLRKIAADLKSGKFGQSAFLVAPDFDSGTFIYYLTREQNLTKPDVYYTFPRDGTIGPAPHKGYSDAWLDETNVSKALDWIAGLDKGATPTLTLISDLNANDSKLMPARARVARLIEEIKKAYPQFTVSRYEGGGTPFEVFQFKLK